MLIIECPSRAHQFIPEEEWAKMSTVYSAGRSVEAGIEPFKDEDAIVLFQSNITVPNNSPYIDMESHTWMMELLEKAEYAAFFFESSAYDEYDANSVIMFQLAYALESEKPLVVVAPSDYQQKIALEMYCKKYGIEVQYDLTSVTLQHFKEPKA